LSMMCELEHGDIVIPGLNSKKPVQICNGIKMERIDLTAEHWQCLIGVFPFLSVEMQMGENKNTC